MKVTKLYPYAKPHPDPIVETASLAGVVPPDITYKHHLEVRPAGCSSCRCSVPVPRTSLTPLSQPVP